METRWSLGTLVGFPAAILGCLALAVCLWLCWRWFSGGKAAEHGEEGLALAGVAVTGLALVAAVVGTAWGMWPYEAEYHQWRTETGTVAQIDSRILSTTDGPTERYVVTFDDGRQRACDDSRCAQVREGDDLTISCKRAWQWAGRHGYDCNFVEAAR